MMMISIAGQASVPCKHRRCACRIAAAGVLLLASASALRAGRPTEVDFAQHVWPILQARCLNCHGPTRQRASLRIDSRQALLAGGDTAPAVVPGKPEESYLLELVAAAAPHPRMPPKGDRLSSEQISILRQWIVEGAKWPAEQSSSNESRSQHWAYQPVMRPAVPQVRTRAKGLTHPIDAFLVDRLAQQNLQMSPAADARTFIRRVTLDLTGLPPAPEEVEAFVRECAADHSGDGLPDAAVARLVDRLLESPRYGERWAQHWLDVIRYADTGGYEKNHLRPSAWPYRDYVIQAFNADTPYPKFLLEQIAGDTVGIDAATGFLVTAPFPTRIEVGQEASAIAQARYNGLDEVLQNLGSAVLGTTVGCARCHDHKFDAISLRDYYRLAATFAGVRFADRAWVSGNGPCDRILAAERRVAELRRKLSEFPAWRESHPLGASELFEPVRAKWVRLTITDTSFGKKYPPALDEVEVWTAEAGEDPASNVGSAGRGAVARSSGCDAEIGSQNRFLNDGVVGRNSIWVAHANVGQDGEVWVELELPEPTVIRRVTWNCDVDDQGFEEPTEDHVPLRWRLPTNWIIQVAEQPGQWHTVVAGNRDEGLKKPLAARKKKLEEQFKSAAAELWELTHVFAGRFHPPATMHVLVRGDPLQQRESIGPGAVDVLGGYELPADMPEHERRLALARWLGSERHPLTARVLVNRLWRHHFGSGIVETPSDFGTQGDLPTHPELLDWLAAEFMEPTVIPPLRKGGPGGVALRANDVSPPTDVTPPNPPFLRGGEARAWSLKHVHRLICTSAAYRQSSRPSAEAAKIDADARLLWRFPPRRLEAEAIRDSVLFVAGSLDMSMGGPGINTFDLTHLRRADEGEWEPRENLGPESWRRTIYLTRIRGADDGVFKAFDVPDCGQVRPKRSDSTTPLQALNLFNSGFILEQSHLLAARAQREGGNDLPRQIDRLFALTVARQPAAEELSACLGVAEQAGLEPVCRSLLNSNEFLFIE